MKSQNESIFMQVSRVFRIPVEALFSAVRDERYVAARSVVVFHLRESGVTTYQTGSILNRDHATVLHLEKVYERISTRGHKFYRQTRMISKPETSLRRREVLDKIDRLQYQIDSLKSKL